MVLPGQEAPRGVDDLQGEEAGEPKRGDAEDAQAGGADEAGGGGTGFLGDAVGLFDVECDRDVGGEADEEEEPGCEEGEEGGERGDDAYGNASPESEFGEGIAVGAGASDGRGVAAGATFGAGGALDSVEVVAALGAVHAADFIGMWGDAFRAGVRSVAGCASATAIESGGRGARCCVFVGGCGSRRVGAPVAARSAETMESRRLRRGGVEGGACKV